MDSSTFTITFIRHGETEYSKKQLVCTHTDAPLNDTGLHQGDLLGQRLMYDAFTKIYSSDLCRAKQTAQCILANSKQEKLPALILDSRLRERNFEELDGKDGKVWVEPALVWSQEEGKTLIQYDPPGVESYDKFKCRVSGFFKEMEKPTGANIVVVTHGMWIRTFLEYIRAENHLFQLDFPEQCGIEESQTPIKNTAITKLRIVKHENDNCTKIELLLHNDDTHLIQFTKD